MALYPSKVLKTRDDENGRRNKSAFQRRGFKVLNDDDYYNGRDYREGNASVENAQMLRERMEEARNRLIALRRGRLIFLLCFLLAILLIPSLAERWAYSTARGVERAKREAAEKFLSEHPEIADEGRVPYVVKKVDSSVVGVKTSVVQSDFFRGSTLAQGQGSGVVVDSDGFIVTNFHVICEQGRLVDGVEIVLSDGRTFSDGITLVGFDENLDVAVLKVEATDLNPIEWGDSDALEVGDSVLALGSPYGLARTVTQGVVSAKERFVFDEQGVVKQEFLQTDAAVNPGNSGGALVDLYGRLVGINTAIYGQQYQGVSFALPVKRVRAVYDEIMRAYRRAR